MPRTYTVFGADPRQVYLAKLLELRGFSILHTTQEFPDSDTLLLPLPSVSQDGLITGSAQNFESVLQSRRAGTSVWGNGLQQYRSLGESLGIALHNYTDYPEFETKNAIPTAEGAIQIAMEQLPTTICGGQFLVIGYGRIGSALAERLTHLGGAVTVARRTTTPIPYPCDITGVYGSPLCDYDAIFNTVPFPVFSEEHVNRTREDCLLMDLASHPGGIAKTGSRRLVHALGLPAKAAPKTAAAIMFDILLSKEEE